MKRLTYEKRRNRWDNGKHPTKYTSRYTFQEVVARLAAYEDTGLDPEEIQRMKEYMEPFTIRDIDRFSEIMQAEKDGRLVVLDEDVALAMSAGARAILNNKRLQGVTYVYDCFGEFGGPKEISYLQAAEILHGIGSTYLTREEAEAALKKREGESNETD